ncbi:hypothetical protein [Natronorubrum halophilum]|uniref:hypothetical protein n=1 Tax=Natronorubrum halophilum TaxID=1702106 RepID=UPI0010C17E88|nr:hypothetical protein [Natronorubrum halophilum]
MSIQTPDLASRLIDEARTALETVADRDPSGIDATVERSIRRERESRRQRRRTPRVIELEPETVVDTPLEGTITVLGAEAGSDLLVEFERAVVSGDTELALDARDRLAAEIDPDTATLTEAPIIADIVYHDRTVVTTSAGSDRFGAAMAPHDGGSLDPTAFEVREHLLEDGDGPADFEWDYCVVVAPPTVDRAERDAAHAAPEDTDTAAVLAGPAGASAAALAFAAGVLIGAAAAGTGSTDPALHQFDSWSTGDAEAGASVQELLNARDATTA